MRCTVLGVLFKPAVILSRRRHLVDDAVDVIEEMPANVVKRIIKNVPPEKRDQINMILRYPKNSTGTIMTTEYVELKTEMTAEDVFKNILASLE